jgi:hypothetical protein
MVLGERADVRAMVPKFSRCWLGHLCEATRSTVMGDKDNEHSLMRKQASADGRE